MFALGKHKEEGDEQKHQAKVRKKKSAVVDIRSGDSSKKESEKKRSEKRGEKSMCNGKS
jgi:hypothetical protein